MSATDEDNGANAGGAEDTSRNKAMIDFIGTFTTLSGSPPQEMADLADGVALFEALSEIAPDYFDPTTIARQLGDNWALKSSNLRKLVRNLEHYYHDGLGQDADFASIDITSVARKNEPESLVILLELVAAAAVSCEEKSTYVYRIMQMPGESQVIMKSVLESSLARMKELDDASEVMDENELVFGDTNDMAMQEAEDDSKLFAASHLRDTMQEEMAQLRQELVLVKSQNDVAQEEAEKSQAKLRAVVEDLQDRLVQRQEELIQVEEDLRKATSQCDELKTQVTSIIEEKNQMADDLEVAQAKAQQLRKAEATLSAYKKKVEGVGNMNQQMVDMEEQVSSYLRQISDLESQVKKSASLPKTIQQLQEQVSQLEKEKAITESSSQATSSEILSLKSRLQASDNAKKMFQEELLELRAQQESTASTEEERERATRLAMDNVRLQKEVQQLKQVTQAVSANAPPTEEITNLQSLVDSLKEELSQKETENAKISSDKDKLEAYTKRTLAKFQDKYLVALQECKAKLKEKQDKIEILESRSASERTAQKREERLLSSTLYELGLAIMQTKLKER